MIPGIIGPAYFWSAAICRSFSFDAGAIGLQPAAGRERESCAGSQHSKMSRSAI